MLEIEHARFKIVDARRTRNNSRLATVHSQSTSTTTTSVYRSERKVAFQLHLVRPPRNTLSNFRVHCSVLHILGKQTSDRSRIEKTVFVQARKSTRNSHVSCFLFIVPSVFFPRIICVLRLTSQTIIELEPRNTTPDVCVRVCLCVCMSSACFCVCTNNNNLKPRPDSSAARNQFGTKHRMRACTCRICSHSNRHTLWKHPLESALIEQCCAARIFANA